MSNSKDREPDWTSDGGKQLIPFEEGYSWVIFLIPIAGKLVSAVKRRVDKCVLGINPDTGEPFPSKEDWYQEAIKTKFF
jgi:hypothetical protein